MGHRITGRLAAQSLVVVGGLLVTLVVAVRPDLLRVASAPGLRVALEATSVCLLVFAATVLAVPPERDVRATRDALVAALVVLALGNGIFGVLPVVTEGRLAVDRGLGFYPWVAARFVAGALFLVAATGRPRLGLGRTVAMGVGALLVVEGALVASGSRLPVPVSISTGAMPEVTVTGPVLHLLLQAVPGVLFGLGAWLAGRLYDETRAPGHLWVSLALALQVFTQANEVLHPAILGPVVTVADAFRLLSFLTLFAGGLHQLHHLYRVRSRAVERQADDLVRQSDTVGRLAALARREHDLRAVVTHELASPLAAIRAWAHVLEAGGDHMTETERRAVAGVGEEARRLAQLVERTEQLRDMEQDGFDCVLQPVRARLLVGDAVQFLRALVGAQPVSASCEDVRVMADPVRFGQLVRNVVTNAARHTPDGEPIAIVGQVRDRAFVLTVTDRGPGIPLEERSLVLEPFVRGTSVTHAGQGVGLYVASRIAQAHGGTLTLTEPPDGPGTCVVVTLGLAS